MGGLTRLMGERAAEAGLGLTGGALFFFVATPTGRRWLAAGSRGAVRGAVMVGTAIGSLFTDLHQGWTDLIQEVRQGKSAVPDPQA
jgi:hypothetical protein